MEPFLAAWLPRDREEASLALVGGGLSLLSFIVVREISPAFRHPELAIIVFAVSYFGGISIGYAAAFSRFAGLVRRWIPAVLLLQLTLLFCLRPVHLWLTDGFAALLRPLGGRGWLLELPSSVVVAGILALTVTPLHAMMLPRSVAIHGRSLRRSYAVEIAGSVAGLVLVPVLAGLGQELLLTFYGLIVLTLAWLAGDRRVVSGVLALLALALVAGHGAIDRRISSWCYEKTYGWKNAAVVYSRHSAYQKIEVVQSGAEPRLMLDGRRQFGGDPTRTYAFFVAEYPCRQIEKPRVAVLGCGSMSTVGLIGRRAASIDIVDIDEEVFAVSCEYFQSYNRLGSLGNWTFHADDAKHYLAAVNTSYDLIVHDIPPARSRVLALTYTREFFQLVKARLSPGGVFSISCLAPGGSDSLYARRLLATLGSVFEHYYVLQRSGALYFYGGGPGMPEPVADVALAQLPAERASGVTFLGRAEIDRLVGGVGAVSVANVGTLIYD
jgi:spermidine synthase